jgi:metallo-beta-lactamase family protein
VKIFGEKHKVKAQVASINGLSAHADQPFLMKYALAVKDRVKGVFLVHGEPRSANALMEKLGSEGLDGVHFPEMGERIEL